MENQKTLQELIYELGLMGLIIENIKDRSGKLPNRNTLLKAIKGERNGPLSKAYRKTAQEIVEQHIAA